MGKDNDRIRKSLKYSIFDGAFSASMIGFGESFFTAFALFLGANNIQVGLLNSLPQAIGSLLQLVSNRLIILFKSRKNLVSTAALLQGLIFIPIISVFFLGTFRVYNLILFLCLYWIFGMILSPAWNSWMGDLTDQKDRGAYFGKRGKITGLASFTTFIIAGIILKEASGREFSQYIGFTVIFLLALFSRITSFIFLKKQYEPTYETAHEAEFSFSDFLKHARSSNYGLLVMYLSTMNFSVYLAAPFFTPYMLNDLRFDYLTFTIVTGTAIIIKMFTMSAWGNASDRFGPKTILSIAGFLMPLVPLLWLFSNNVLYLIIIQIYSGFIWAGFEISALNFIFDTTSSQKRATCIAYYNVINGFALLSGSVLGGLIVRYNDVFWSSYLLVFIISFIMRFTASSIFIPKIKEVRPIEVIPYPKLFLKVMSTMPTIGLIYYLIPFRKNNLKK